MAGANLALMTVDEKAAALRELVAAEAQLVELRLRRLAMAVRDRTCRADGCDVPATWCEAHHLDPWHTGGRTDVADGVLLCSHHHHRVHDARHRVERSSGGVFTFHLRR